MASIIRVKRSTGTLAPATLNYGELAYTTGVGTHGNRGQRLFIGDNSGNPQLVGGQYYTDLLSIAPGLVAGQSNPTTAANGFVPIVDSTGRVDQWNVDNLRLDGNAFTSTDTDGHITITPNGTGRVQFLDDDELQFGTSDDIRVSYDTVKDAVYVERGTAGTTADFRFADDLHVQFGTDNDARIYYDEASTDRLVIEGASWTYNSSVAQVAISTTTASTNTTTGALIVGGGVGITSDVNIGGTLNVAGTVNFTSGNVTITNDLTVNGNTTLGNAPSDQITITGAIFHTGVSTHIGPVTIDNVGISSNTISTKSGGGNILYIDPYPDGLSNEGTVVIKGDLQVDGTTTTVNSNTVSINDAILNLGDVTSVRTVMAPVLSGVSTITLDSVVGINTGDIFDAKTGLPATSADRTITAYNAGTKVVTIQGTTTANIGISTQLTITHAFDTNTDRGISFNYNTSTGSANNKVGFFGYHDTTSGDSSAPERSWTYIPDATISNEVVTGTRGNLDIKGIYYQTGDYSTHGVVYFDVNGLQTSTNNPNTASNTRTSTQILTAVTEITLDLPSAHTVVAGQQVTQVNNSSAYGVVKTSSSGTTITLIGVQGTFDTTNDLKVEGSNISKIPSTVTTIYTNKPTWTDTLDGGTF